jgi:hypothetical protein
MAALHHFKDAVRPALHRQVQIRGQRGDIPIGFDQCIAELDRMRGREPDALDTFDRRIV